MSIGHISFFIMKMSVNFHLTETLEQNRMKHILLTLLSLVLPLSMTAQTLDRHSLRDQGLEREYYLYLPENIKPDAPLVFSLHGYGGQALNVGQGLREVADRYGFAVCYPQGSKDELGKTCWNVGYTVQKNMKVNDVDFLCHLARHLQKTCHLSRKNTFCTGYSNGGEMCYLLAYLKPDVFAAVAPIAGLTLKWMYDDLEPKRPVPVMEVHGTLDRTSWWNGNLEDDYWGHYIAVPLAVHLWAATARCTHEETLRLPQRRNEVILHKYVGGKPVWKKGPATEVWLYEVVNGIHSCAEKDMDTWEEVWKFFSKYLR